MLAGPLHLFVSGEELTNHWSICSKLVSPGPSLISDRNFSSVFFFPVDCLDPTCSSHGVCVNGECLCSPGWGGLNCELARVQCPDQCSGHGTYLPDTGLCSCDPNWMGPDCSVGKPRGFLHAFPVPAPCVPSVSPGGWAAMCLTGLGTAGLGYGTVSLLPSSPRPRSL